MLLQIFLTTIALPLALGVVIAIAGKGSSTARIALMALLLPLAAALASVAIEGIPPFPPVAARHKFPLVLAAGAIVFGLVALVARNRLSRLPASLLAIASLALPTWWLGRNILAANPVKAATVAVILVLAAIALPPFSATRQGGGRPSGAPAALVASFLWVSIAAAISAVLGGYIGMAQMNGALAAMAGGFLLMRYAHYLRGSEHAFRLDGMAAFAFLWTVTLALVMTALFAPGASATALVLALFPVGVGYWLSSMTSAFAPCPRWARPLLSGAMTSIPSAAAILIAAFQQA